MSWIRHFEPWEIAVCDFLGAQKAATPNPPFHVGR